MAPRLVCSLEYLKETRLGNWLVHDLELLSE